MDCRVFVGIQIDILESRQELLVSAWYGLADCLCYSEMIFIWFSFRKISAKEEEK